MNQADHIIFETILSSIRPYVCQLETWLAEPNPAIERLLALGDAYERIADLGCGGGQRTIALMLRLRAVEVVGIDKKQHEIDTACRQVIEQTLCPIKQGIEKIKQVLGPDDRVVSRLSADVRAEVERLLKYEGIPIPDYRRGDITKGKDSTGLEGDYYDLAYSRYVLYHIYCEEGGTSYANTGLAIQEMARVTKPGGLVVAYEPIVCGPTDNTPVDLKPLFEQREELRFVDQVVLDGEAVYIYRKV